MPELPLQNWTDSCRPHNPRTHSVSDRSSAMVSARAANYAYTRRACRRPRDDHLTTAIPCAASRPAKAAAARERRDRTAQTAASGRQHAWLPVRLSLLLLQMNDFSFTVRVPGTVSADIQNGEPSRSWMHLPPAPPPSVVKLPRQLAPMRAPAVSRDLNSLAAIPSAAAVPGP